MSLFEVGQLGLVRGVPLSELVHNLSPLVVLDPPSVLLLFLMALGLVTHELQSLCVGVGETDLVLRATHRSEIVVLRVQTPVTLTNILLLHRVHSLNIYS